MELSFGRRDFGDVEVEVSNGIGFELLLFARGRVAFELRQPPSQRVS
jgi:hypothetical protein